MELCALSEHSGTNSAGALGPRRAVIGCVIIHLERTIIWRGGNIFVIF